MKRSFLLCHQIHRGHDFQQIRCLSIRFAVRRLIFSRLFHFTGSITFSFNQVIHLKDQIGTLLSNGTKVSFALESREEPKQAVRVEPPVEQKIGFFIGRISDQSYFATCSDCLCPAGDAQLVENVADVPLYGRIGNHQPFSDIPVGCTLGNQTEHF